MVGWLEEDVFPTFGGSASLAPPSNKQCPPKGPAPAQLEPTRSPPKICRKKKKDIHKDDKEIPETPKHRQVHDE